MHHPSLYKTLKTIPLDRWINWLINWWVEVLGNQIQWNSVHNLCQNNHLAVITGIKKDFFYHLERKYVFVCKFDSKLKRRCRRANMWCLLCGFWEADCSLAMCDHLLCCLLCDKNPDIGALCTDLMSCIQIKSQSRQALEDLEGAKFAQSSIFCRWDFSTRSLQSRYGCTRNTKKFKEN